MHKQHKLIYIVPLLMPLFYINASPLNESSFRTQLTLLSVESEDVSLVADRFKEVTREESSETRLKLWLQSYDALKRIVDPTFDLKDRNNRASMRVGVLGIPFSGMDPKDVKDPELRKRYEAAILANKEKGDKFKQQKRIQLEIDELIQDLPYCLKIPKRDSALVISELKKRGAPTAIVSDLERNAKLKEMFGN